MAAIGVSAPTVVPALAGVAPSSRQGSRTHTPRSAQHTPRSVQQQRNYTSGAAAAASEEQGDDTTAFFARGGDRSKSKSRMSARFARPQRYQSTIYARNVSFSLRSFVKSSSVKARSLGKRMAEEMQRTRRRLFT